MFFSIIIPVYNRPGEIDELLESLTKQSYTEFEVLVIEDGSELSCKEIAEAYKDRLDLRYYFKENSGQGYSRNYGFERAEGDYLVVFDSDCLIPSHYLETVCNHLRRDKLDAYGGPDRAHPSFSPLQKAISYSMTSPFSTGGIRGNRRHSGTFHPRSFNMGISREVYKRTGGYAITRMGEDIEFSIRIIREGFSTGLIPEAYVYHKRRTSLYQFYRQLHFFGRARVNIGRFYPNEIKPIHLLPAFFTLGCLLYISTPFWNQALFQGLTGVGLLGASVVALDAGIKCGSAKVGLFGVATTFVQISAYGVGFLTELYGSLRE